MRKEVMRRSCMIILLSLVAAGVWAQYQSPIVANKVTTKKVKKEKVIVTGHEMTHYMAFGVHGGASLNYGAPQGTQYGIGLGGLLDVHYEFYRHAKKASYGMMTGLSGGYQQTSFKQDEWQYAYSTSTDCGEIGYILSANNVVENRRRITVEVPVMFALITDKGLFFRIGPRLAVPVWESGTVSFSKADVKAYFKKEDVEVLNQLITGKVNTNQPNVKYHAPLLSLKVGTELGGAIRLPHGDKLFLGVYVDWTGMEIYRSTEVTHLIEITPPSNTGPAEVVYNAPSDQYARQLGQIAAGAKISYHFNLMSKHKKGPLQ